MADTREPLLEKDTQDLDKESGKTTKGKPFLRAVTRELDEECWKTTMGEPITLKAMLDENTASVVNDFDMDNNEDLDDTEKEFLHVHIQQQLVKRLMEANAMKALEFFKTLSTQEDDADAWQKLTEKWEYHGSFDLISKVLPALRNDHVLVKAFFDSLVFSIPMDKLVAKDCRQPMKTALRRMILHRSLASQNTMVIQTFADKRPESDEADKRPESDEEKEEQPAFPIPKELIKLTFIQDEGFLPYEARECDYAFTLANLLEDDEMLFEIISFVSTSLVNKDDVMDNLLINAVLTKGWEKVKRLFYVGMVMDLVFVGFLVRVAYNGRLQRIPSLFVLFVLFSLTFCSAIELLAFTIMEYKRLPSVGDGCMRNLLFAMKRMKRSLSMSHFAEFDWFVVFYQFGLFSIATYVAIGEHLSSTSRTHGVLINHHPVWNAFLMCAKTQQVTIKVLAIRRIGENVLPAYRSVFDGITLTFLAFLFLQVFNSFLVYYTIPVDAFDSTAEGRSYQFFENIFMTFLTMFRLDISGDFDMGDLDGTNQYIDENNELQNAPEDPYHHHGICLIYMFFATFIGVGWLNILIGLLSNRYDSFYEKRFQIFEAFRVVYTYKSFCLLRCFESFCKPSSSSSSQTADTNQDKDGKRMAWLKYKKDMFSVMTPKDIILKATDDPFLETENENKKAWMEEVAGMKNQLKDGNTFDLDGTENKWIKKLQNRNPFYAKDVSWSDKKKTQPSFVVLDN